MKPCARTRGIPLLLKYLANRIRGYTNKVRLRGLGKVKSFEPAEAGFVCIAEAVRCGGSPRCSNCRPDFSLLAKRHGVRAMCKSGMHPNNLPG